jgi:hypothetical protein
MEFLQNIDLFFTTATIVVTGLASYYIYKNYNTKFGSRWMYSLLKKGHTLTEAEHEALMNASLPKNKEDQKDGNSEIGRMVEDAEHQT